MQWTLRAQKKKLLQETIGMCVKRHGWALCWRFERVWNCDKK